MSHEVHFRLTKAQREAIRRIGRDGTYMVPEWVSVGEAAREVISRVYANQERLGKDSEDVLYGNLWELYEDHKLDTDWVTEYLAHHDNVNHQEEN